MANISDLQDRLCAVEKELADERLARTMLQKELDDERAAHENTKGKIGALIAVATIANTEKKKLQGQLNEAKEAIRTLESKLHGF